MLRLRLTLPLVLLVLLFSTEALAVEKFLAILTNASENPDPTLTKSTGGPRPVSFGYGIFELNDAETALTMVAKISNIDVNGGQTPTDTNDNLTNAHIHAPATPPDGNAGVVWGFHGLPDHDISPHDEVVTPFANIPGGMFTSTWNATEGSAGLGLAGRLTAIRNGQAYLNFHTQQNVSGEIRGFLMPIPEPSTLLLLAICASVLALRTRR